MEDEFDDVDFDASALEAIDALEQGKAVEAASAQQLPRSRPPPRPAVSTPTALSRHNSFGKQQRKASDFTRTSSGHFVTAAAAAAAAARREQGSVLAFETPQHRKRQGNQARVTASDLLLHKSGSSSSIGRTSPLRPTGSQSPVQSHAPSSDDIVGATDDEIGVGRNAPAPPTPVANALDGIDDSTLWDDDLLGAIDEIEGDLLSGPGPSRPPPQAVAGPSRVSFSSNVAGPSRLPIQAPTARNKPSAATSAPAPRNSSQPRASGRSGQLVQRTLFGDVAPSQGQCLLASTSAHDIESPTRTTGTHRTKQWDRTAYAKSGPAHMRRNKTGAAGLVDDDVEEDWDEGGAYEHFAAVDEAQLPVEPPKPMRLKIDEEAAKTWIYPTNKEHRDYQFNIVQKALFNNVLVALPTGLGKTFIAAVVILNYFRWFPEGKIIFVAPTRPLVNQQQQACHGICGLPWDTAVEMTGTTKAALRGDEWKSKRIFYMTPQCLENDLFTSSVDALDVICIVIDEAHRATGGYAYGNVIQYMMQRNPNFRVLALTATPGNTPEKVQEVVDKLRISVIEIRTEEALDIRRYIHKKHEDPVTVPLTEDMEELRRLWGSLMKPHQDALEKSGVLRAQPATVLHFFAVSSILKEPRHRAILGKNRSLYSKISELSGMARAMQHLNEYSVQMFRDRILEYSPKAGANGTGKKGAGFTSTAAFRNLVAKLDAMEREPEGLVHSKMHYLRDAVWAHFENEEAEGRDTRVMVFCSLRECVAEIVAFLNESGRGKLRVTPFVGQSADKKGNKGFTQKDQERVIGKFKQGEFNVIVATSIGEEGLDIGEVDLIVCYEAVKDSVRMLQRVGRTGRKRDGKIIVLMTEGRESSLWRQSKDNYKAVQDDITRGLRVELFDDVPRLVPPHIHPRPEKRLVEQPKFEPSMIAQHGKGRKKAASKPKRNSDPMRNVPQRDLFSFMKASDVHKKGRTSSGSRRGPNDQREVDDLTQESMQSSAYTDDGDSDLALAAIAAGNLSDDSDDEELNRGINLAGRTSSSSAGNQPRSSSGAQAKAKGKAKATAPSKTPVSNARQPLGIGESAGSASGSDSARKGTRLGVRRALPAARATTQPEVISLASSPMGPPLTTPSRAPSLARSKTVSAPTVQGRSSGRKLAISDEDEDDEFDDAWDVDALNGLTPAVASRAEQQPADPPSPEVVYRPAPHPLVAQLAAASAMEIGVDADDDAVAVAGSSRSRATADRSIDESPMLNRRPARGAPRRLLQSSSPLNSDGARMPPPALPRARADPAGAGQGAKRAQAATHSDEDDEKPVRAAPKRSRLRRHQTPSADESSTVETTSKRAKSGVKGKEGKAGEAKQTPQKKSKKRKEPKKLISRGSPTSRALFRYEADLTSEEERAPDEDDEGLDTDEADSSDLEHVGHFEPTQAPKGYDQRSVYARSLLTQGDTSLFNGDNGGGGGGGRGRRRRLAPVPALASPRSARIAAARFAASSGRSFEQDTDYEKDSFIASSDEEEQRAAMEESSEPSSSLL